MEELNISKRLSEIDDYQKELEVEKMTLIEKGLRSSSPKDILFANKLLQNQRGHQKSFIFDPLNTQEFNGYRERPYEINFATLRRMASSTTVVSAIITTRKEQVAAYSSYSDDNIKPGWKIEKNIDNYFGDDEETKALKKLSKEEKEEVRKIISFVENCGVKKRLYHGDDIESFLRKFVDDSLTIDQACFEIIPTKFYKPYEFFCVDGSTFRFAATNPTELAGSVYERGYLPYAVQLYQGTIYNYYYPWELCFGIRNPNTSILSNGYGLSEMECLIKIITWILYSEAYNGKFFSQGSNPKGVFVAEGNLSDDKISEFKQTWRAQVAGVDNAWKIPFISGGTKVNWIDMQKTNSDMEFYRWLEYLIRLTCAIFKIDPRELGFNLDGADSINYESSVQQKLQFSKEKGLVPLLRFVEKCINKYVVFPLSGSKYKFKFTGVDDSDQIIMNFDLAKVEKGVMSWKEFRAKYLLPSEISEDDFLLNPTWIQYKQMQAGQQMNEQNQMRSNMFGTGNPADTNYMMGGENQQTVNPEAPVDYSDINNVFKTFQSNPFVKDLDTYVKNNFSENHS